MYSARHPKRKLKMQVCIFGGDRLAILRVNLPMLDERFNMVDFKIYISVKKDMSKYIYI